MSNVQDKMVDENRPIESASEWASFCPYYAHLGVELEHLLGGVCRIRLKAKQEIGNSKGGIHGGAMAGLADIALSQAVRSAYQDPVAVATVSLTVNYLAKADGDITATAKVIRAGKSIAYSEADILDGGGAVVGRVSATHRVNIKR